MRFAVKFLGCKVSHADAMLARQRLLEAGHEEAPEDEAELHVINTCCITGEAEAKSRQSVRRSLKSAREVYVGGLRGQPQRAAVRRDRSPRCGPSPAPPTTSPKRWPARSAPAPISSTSRSSGAASSGVAAPRERRGASAPPRRARAASSRCRTAATATAPTASSRRSAAARARARRRRCSERCSGGWPRASRRW